MPTRGADPANSRTAGSRFHVEDLLTPAAFPHAIRHLELRQTHVSWVLLTGPFAYKIKRPVRYDFIDSSTLALRHALCEEELRLNRKLAPDMYLDVVPITEENGRLRMGGKGVPVEYAVRMHEFDASLELASELERGTVTPHDMATFAARLAGLHDRAAVARQETPYGSHARVRRQMLDNLRLLRTHLGSTGATGELELLFRWTEEFLTHLRPLIESRKRLGAVRECHGDLHARNIVRWRQQWLPFDCLEFDPGLRWIDVMSDTAFLYMDLRAHGREDLACEFLSRYLEQTGDYQGLRLLPLYAAYRALVRAKVDALGAETAGPAERRALEARLTRRMETALGYVTTPAPVLVVMHGVTGCGKSWLSERLVPAIHALRIRSDLERRRGADAGPPARRDFGVGSGPYTQAAIRRTYERLLECAGSALAGGCSAIVDATFLQSAHRRMFRELAVRRGCRFLILSCCADRVTLAARLKTRAQGGLDPSEANEAVLEEQLRTREELSAEELVNAVVIDTGSLTAADAGMESIRSRLALERRPAA